MAPPPTGEQPSTAQLLPACHVPSGSILDPWEAHVVLKSQPHHQASLGGHQQLPLSPLVQWDQTDWQGKARPTEITTQGYKRGSGSHNPPSLPIADPPPCYPRAPGPPIRLFVLHSRWRRCAGVGCSPQRCSALSPRGSARLGLPARCCGRSRAAACSLAGGLTAVTSPAWRRRGGPHCLLPWRGPATMSRTVNCCCETDGVSQAQGEAKVRGQEEQRGGTAPLPTRPWGGGSSQATLCLSRSRRGQHRTQQAGGRLPPTHPAHLDTGPTLGAPAHNPEQAAAARHIKGCQEARGAGAGPQPFQQMLEPPAIAP